MLTHDDTLPVITASLSVAPQTNGLIATVPMNSADLNGGMDLNVTIDGMSAGGQPLFSVGEYVYQITPGSDPVLMYEHRTLKTPTPLGLIVNVIASGDLQISWHNSELSNGHDINATITRQYVSNQ